MSVGLQFDDRDFQAAIEELLSETSRDDTAFVTNQSIRLVRQLVSDTPVAEPTIMKGDRSIALRNKGRARAGWFAAWKRLGAFGTPKGVKIAMLGKKEGSFVDGRQRTGNTFFEMTNSVNYIGTLDDEHNILDRAIDARAADMEEQLARRYSQSMRRRSAV